MKLCPLGDNGVETFCKCLGQIEDANDPVFFNTNLCEHCNRLGITGIDFENGVQMLFASGPIFFFVEKKPGSGFVCVFVVRFEPQCLFDQVFGLSNARFFADREESGFSEVRMGVFRCELDQAITAIEGECFIVSDGMVCENKPCVVVFRVEAQSVKGFLLNLGEA